MRFVPIAAALLAGTAGFAHADILYGITRTQLVRIDTDNPGIVELVGNHGLSVTTSGTKSHGAFSLTYDRDSHKLFGLHYEYIAATGNFGQSLVSYDLTTGLGTVEAYLGDSATAGYFESIEYVDSENSLVVSSGLTLNDGTYSQAFYTMASDGSRSFLSANGRDNDYAVYDQSRGRFYVTDPNGVGRLSLVDLGTGATMDLGSILSSTGDLAYSADTDRILAYVVGTDELVSLGNGLTSQSPVSLGLVGNAGVIQGLAFATDEEAPPPCPADLDGDGSITGRDFWLFVKYYYRRDSRADINGDGRVNYHDFYAFFEAYFRGC